jgi:hypothetical protein
MAQIPSQPFAQASVRGLQAQSTRSGEGEEWGYDHADMGGGEDDEYLEGESEEEFTKESSDFYEANDGWGSSSGDDEEDQIIPSFISAIYPLMTEDQWMELQLDPGFLKKKVELCSSCADVNVRRQDRIQGLLEPKQSNSMKNHNSTASLSSTNNTNIQTPLPINTQHKLSGAGLKISSKAQIQKKRPASAPGKTHAGKNTTKYQAYQHKSSGVQGEDLLEHRLATRQSHR